MSLKKQVAPGVTVTRHLDYLTPFSAAEDDDELKEIALLKSMRACSLLEVDASFFSRMVEGMREYKAWKLLGFASFEEFCSKQLGKTLDEVEKITAGVRVLATNGVTNPTRQQAITAAAGATTGEVRAHADNQHAQIAQATQAERAKEIGVSRRTQQTLDKLKRHHPELHAAVAAGEMSCNAAAIEAGIVKVKTPLEKALDAFRKLEPTERDAFLALINDE